MAIDTRAKRQNAAWIGWGPCATKLPSGLMNAFARAVVSLTYAGIPITPPSATDGGLMTRILGGD